MMVWTPFSEPKLSREQNDAIAARIRDVLQSWKGTRYCAGQRAKGVAVDCVRFATACVDELFRVEHVPLETLPPDAAFHAKKTAIRAMRRIRRLYEPMTRVVDDIVQPMDIVVTGPRNGGPGHMMLVGWRPNTMWETGTAAVREVGWTIADRVFRVYRLGERHAWRNP